eukprot:jgi/Picsp_1/4619/NSC_01989-R1_sam dependent carboxyl methyltransferase
MGDSNVHRPVGEDGAGEYTAATKGCFDVIAAASPAILESIEKMKIYADSSKHGRPFTIADYGTADAGTSLGLMCDVIARVRARDPEREVLIVYEDQTNNEWKSVFKHAYGLIQVTDAYGRQVECPTQKYDKVFVSAVGMGFHTQVLPSSSVDLGVAFTAMHWLSKQPEGDLLVGYEGALQCAQLAAGDDRTRPHALQAAADWESILKARAAEMRQGAQFMCVNFCKSKEGYYLGKTDKGQCMFDNFIVCWNALHAKGVISDKERVGVSFQSYYRTLEEMVDPVLVGGGSLESLGLKVVSADVKVVRCPYREAWESGSSQAAGRDAQAHAAWYVPTTRTWSNSTFETALGSKRSAEERADIMKQFWKEYEMLVAKDPAEHGMDYVHGYCLYEKI